MTHQQPPVTPVSGQPQQDIRPPGPAKSRTVPILIGVVALLVLAVAGLGFALFTGDHKTEAKPAASAAAAAPSAVATTTAPASFDSTADLRAALVAAGVACNNPELVKHDGKGPIGLTDDTISCDHGGAEIDLDVYDSADNASGRLAYQAALLEGFGLDPAWFATGENWTVQCETQADCEDVTAAIGGRVESTA